MASKKRSAANLSGKIASVGQAKKTKDCRSSAWKCFDRYQEDREEDILEELDELDDTDAKGDLIVCRLVAFANYMIDTPIKQQNNTGKLLGDDGCKQYLSGVKEEIKKVTPTLPIWIDPEWYSDLRKRLGEGKSRGIMTGDYEFRDPSARALPIRCGSSDLRQTERMWEVLQGVDLESICKSIIAGGTSNAYRERAKIVSTALSVGRGGEVKFLRYDLMWWDDEFLCLEAIWTRLKTVMQQPLYYQCDFDGYICDIYHALGCLFAVEDGLFRLDTSKRGELRLVFPDLWQISNDAVASRMTTLIRSHSAPELKKHNQSRSIRVGSNTSLANHRDVRPEDQRNAGGFKSGFNTDLYSRMNPKLGMTAANALARHPNALKKVYPPTLDSLVGRVDAEGLDCLMSKLYLISVPFFQERGSLRPLLRTCTAKLIMEHPTMRKDFGRSNEMVRKLVDSMTKAKLAVGPVEASQKLDEWSSVIRENYITNNNLIPNATEATMLEVIQHQSLQMNKLIMEQQKLTGEVVALKGVIASQSTSIVTGIASSITSAFQGMWQSGNGVAPVAGSIAGGDSNNLGESPASPVSSPPSSPSRVSNLPSATVSSEREPLQDEPLPEILSTFVNSMQEMVREADERGGKNTLLQLSWDATSGSSAKDVTIKEILISLVNEKKLYTKQKLYNVEPAGLPSKNRGHYWACMELVESVITPEQNNLLRLKKSEQEKIEDFDDIVKIAAYTIEDAAFMRMGELDGKTRSNLRRTYAGVGNRYSNYCKEKNVERIKASHSNAAAAASVNTGGGGIKNFFSAVKNAISPGKK